MIATIVLIMLFSPPQNVHIQIDKYFRHGNACFKGLDCTAYTKQHMTQIDFTRNSQERFAGTRVNDQEATQTKHMHILSRRNFCRPPAASHDRVREGPTKLFQEKSAWGHDHKTPHRRDERFIKIRVKDLDPPCPHRFLQSFFGVLSRVWSSVDL